jgi:hypothetical protein
LRRFVSEWCESAHSVDGLDASTGGLTSTPVSHTLLKDWADGSISQFWIAVWHAVALNNEATVTGLSNWFVS